MEKRLKDIAIELCMNGENCSRSILLAGSIKYNLDLEDTTVNCCGGISSGFGFGGMCSAIVAGVMLLGIIYPNDDEAKQKSLVLFFDVQSQLGSMNCSCIAGEDNCYHLLSVISDALENIIET